MSRVIYYFFLISAISYLHGKPYQRRRSRKNRRKKLPRPFQELSVCNVYHTDADNHISACRIKHVAKSVTETESKDDGLIGDIEHFCKRKNERHKKKGLCRSASDEKLNDDHDKHYHQQCLNRRKILNEIIDMIKNGVKNHSFFQNIGYGEDKDDERNRGRDSLYSPAETAEQVLAPDARNVACSQTAEREKKCHCNKRSVADQRRNRIVFDKLLSDKACGSKNKDAKYTCDKNLCSLA